MTFEIAPLAFMRGRTLARSFVILDESQNTTVEQMRMFLTRIGKGSRAVVTGDPTQTDLPHNQRSGFHHAYRLLKDVDGIAMVELTAVDVVRHRLVRQIIEKRMSEMILNDTSDIDYPASERERTVFRHQLSKASEKGAFSTGIAGE